jgi:hypothetical protein
MKLLLSTKWLIDYSLQEKLTIYCFFKTISSVYFLIFTGQMEVAIKKNHCSVRQFCVMARFIKGFNPSTANTC